MLPEKVGEEGEFEGVKEELRGGLGAEDEEGARAEEDTEEGGVGGHLR